MCNIENNSDYANVEFVLLDYNSNDGLADYIKLNMMKFIKNGKLIYYRTTAPKYFHRSHSRNLAFRLATGDILCNLDADNFTGEGFATYINTCFTENDKIFISTLNDHLPIDGDFLGRLCFSKKDFYKVKGFDERIENYGFEDYDIINRLKLSGLLNIRISDTDRFLKAIRHSDDDRIKNESVLNRLKRLLIRYISSSCSEIIFLFDENQYARGTIIDNISYKFLGKRSPLQISQMKYEYSILEEKWHKGIWYEDQYSITLKSNGCLQKFLLEGPIKYSVSLSEEKEYYYVITDRSLFQQAVMFYSQLKNRIIMHENALNKKLAVNNKFGNGAVSKNFSSAEFKLL